METWDLYDHSRNPLNRTHVRGTPLPTGQYHVVVEVWTVNSREEVLLTLRSPISTSFPSQWETTCGSVLAGETSRNAALRELREETGIVVNARQIHFVKSFRKTASFVDVYLVCRDISIQEIKLQSAETTAAKWVSFGAIKQMLTQGTLAFPTGKNPDEIYKKYKEQQISSFIY